MYQNISEEMLRLFATTVEFNNLVGEPVNRYRQEYKSLGKLREAFLGKLEMYQTLINLLNSINGLMAL